MASSILRADGVAKRFGRNWIFQDISFQLDKGEILAIRGRNGVGKSTLIKILAGLVAPSKGTVVRPDSVGYMALDLELYSGLTAAEHLQWAADCRGCEPRTAELLAMVGLADTKSKLTRAFSSGMKTRLKLALAIQHRPKLLILDEPGASLDSEGFSMVDEVVHRQDWSCIIASNDQTEIKWGHRTLDLDA